MLTPEQQKAADKRAHQLLRAKQQERAQEGARALHRHSPQEAAPPHHHAGAGTRARHTDQAEAAADEGPAARQGQPRQAAAGRGARRGPASTAHCSPRAPSGRCRPSSPTRSPLRSSLPASELSSRPTETTKLLAGRWRQLSAGEKSKWEAQYRAAIPAYEQQLAQWNEQQKTHRPPTRPLNAYARYAQTRIREIRAAEGGGERASELMKRVAGEWKGLAAEEKDRLRAEVVSDMAGYGERMKEWEGRPADELAMWRLQRATQKKKRERRKAKLQLSKQSTDSSSRPATTTTTSA